MEAQTTKLVKKNKAPLATTTDFTDGGWDQEVVDTKDIIIPKLLLMHGTSDLVKKGDRNQGEFVKSTSGELLAKRGEKVEVIVFEKSKEWRIMRKNPDSGRYEYVRIDTWTPENDDLPWDFSENGETYRRDKVLNFYGVLASEAATGSAFPIRLSFSRTSFNAGRKIADAYARAIMEKQAPTRQTFLIGSELVNGKAETYFAMTAEAGKSTTDEQKKLALEWRKVVINAKANQSLVDHEEETHEAGSVEDTTEF